MRPHEEEWEVVVCGKPEHGPEFGCWNVKDATGWIVLRDVNKATAERYAAFPAMARALKAFLSDHGHTPDCGYSGYGDHQCSTECAGARSALTKAGVL